MYFTNVAAVALMSLVGNTMAQCAASDRVALVAVPEARAITVTEGDILMPSASASCTVTVTVTSIPDYCLSTAPVSILTTAAPLALSTSCTTATLAVVASAGPLAIPTGGIFPVPKNVTAMIGTGTGARSTTTASKTLTLVSVSPTAPIPTSNDATSGGYSVLLLVATVGLAFVHSVVLV